ncbi:MAG: GNAT family N-acetyltransferase [Gammaproteobacteria bacterium]
MLQLKPPFRHAEKSDCRYVAELIDIAGEGVPYWFWSRQAEKENKTPLQIGMERAAREDVDFSYRNAVFMEMQGRVAAMILGYKLPESTAEFDVEAYPEIARPFIELERLVPGSFYINALATYPEYRRLGCGSKLLNLAHDLAAEAGCELTSIEVYERNEGAVRLYRRQGFEIVDRRPVAMHSSQPYDGDIVLLTRVTEVCC